MSPERKLSLMASREASRGRKRPMVTLTDQVSLEESMGVNRGTPFLNFRQFSQEATRQSQTLARFAFHLWRKCPRDFLSLLTFW